ncbi:cupin domain-containing protein [Fodinibius halophilus]|uniref:Cupin domain-containing protein n=1 Tax=Fodinibius halophilus TaxID=1736908 RepID=A0A6M1T5G1_9BACT|nr:cupin domain-containing protein [Fodinibius halophilus]NGP88505.1 cupin domain-containing protein [Fodinibius halophilus]
MYTNSSIFVTVVLTLLLFPTLLIAQDQGDAFVRSIDADKLEWGGCPEFMPKSCSIAVLQGDPAEPNADIFFKMEGNTEVPNHWHHSAERMVLVSGEMKVEYEGQKPEVIKTGSYAYGPPEKRHKAACISEESCVLFIAFEEPIDAFAVE